MQILGVNNEAVQKIDQSFKNTFRMTLVNESLPNEYFVHNRNLQAKATRQEI